VVEKCQWARERREDMRKKEGRTWGNRRKKESIN